MCLILDVKKQVKYYTSCIFDCKHIDSKRYMAFLVHVVLVCYGGLLERGRSGVYRKGKVEVFNSFVHTFTVIGAAVSYGVYLLQL